MEQLVDKESEHNSADSDLRSPQVKPQVKPLATDGNLSFASQNWQILDWRAIKNTLLNRIDLSEVEFEDIWQTLQSLYQRINSSEEELKPPFNTIRNDVEDYLWHVPSWYLTCQRGWQEFKEVIYDPEANPVEVRSQLEQFQLKDFVELLQQRNDLDSDRSGEIVEQLEAIRQEVFSQLEQVESQQQQQQLSELLKDYLKTVEATQLQADNLSSQIEQLLIKSGLSVGVLIQFLQSWQQLDWQTWLEQRQDFEPKELKQIAEQLASIGDRLLDTVEVWQVQIASTTKALQHKLECYLRYTSSDHLIPEKIDAKLEQLWQEAVDNLPESQPKSPEIDRSGLVEILEKRKGIDAEQGQAIVTQIETNWQKLNGLATPEISQLQTLSVELSGNLLDYLEKAIEQNLNLAEMEADLLPVLNLAKEETTTLIEQQLARLNWDEMEAKLNQAQKYSHRQIRQTIKQTREATRKLIKLPRRWSTRTSEQVEDLVEEIEAFFSHANKNEFISEYLESNLKTIFHYTNIQSHANNNSVNNNLDRLAKLTPAKIHKSLADREDITPVESEQISDRSLAIIARLFNEINQTQDQTNQLIQQILDSIGEYLHSLNLFHLDYEQIKTNLASFDFQSLTDSWQETMAEIPLEQLGDRLEKFSQETLAKIMQTKELFPDSAKEQIQGIQDYIAQQIKTIKLTTERRTESLKQQTLQQIDASRKAIAAATYWMFAISFTSAVASVLAGFLATTISL